MDTLSRLRAGAERLLASDRITAPTRAALRERLDRRFGAPRTFDATQMRVLRAAAARLIPAPELAEAVNLAGALDAWLTEGDGDGWRYADLPPDRELHRLGLDALDAAATGRFGKTFDALGAEAQDELLGAAASGELPTANALDAARWFEELLATLVELHVSHPLVQISIGYDGMADARGWQAVGLAEVATEAARSETEHAGPAHG